MTKRQKRDKSMPDDYNRFRDPKTGEYIRSPVFCILGHVDSGKTSLLDKVRGTAVQARETAGITQHIGASFIPNETIYAVSGKLMEAMGIGKLDIPGILFVDTPGHASFINLRQRGASAANLAVLVIEIVKGIQPQTIESIRILKENRTPFVIALNKIDRFGNWQSHPELSMVQSLKMQRPRTLEEIDHRIYEIMTELYDIAKVSADRFDRVTGDELTKKVVIIPTSAITGEGIPELFLFLSGLSQKYLRNQLKFSPEETGSGSILEVKESPMGKTLDVLLLNGVLRKNDRIILGGLNGIIETHVRAILQPKPLDEIRDPRDRFDSVDEIVAAAGVKIVAPDIEDAIAGSTLYVIRENSNTEILKKEIQEEFSKAFIETDQKGILLKTDALGSLEALVKLLKENNIPIRRASVGNVTKRDVIDAELTKKEDEQYGAILSFNAPTLPDAQEYAQQVKIRIFTNDVIYRLVEDYKTWVQDILDQEKFKQLKELALPGKIKILPHIFRQSNPAVVGVAILAGQITPKARLINNSNERIGEILQIQDSGEALSLAKVGQEIAISIKGPTVGRQIKEGDELYVDLSESQAMQLQQPEIKGLLTGSDMLALQNLIEIKRKFSGQRFWGLP